MHIAVVDLVANPGAGQRFTGLLARAFASAGIDLDVTLVAPAQALRSGVFGNTSSCRQVGLITDQTLQRWFPNRRILDLPGSWRSSNFLRENILKAFFDLQKQILLAIKTADLVYFPWPNFVPLPVVFGQSLPMVMTLHDLLWKYVPVYDPSQEVDLDCRVTDWLQRMDCIVTITRHLQTDLSRYFPGSAQRIEVIYQAATDLSNFHDDGSKRLQALSVTKPYFLMVAGLWSHKNHSNLLRAISGLYRDRCDHRFLFVGIHTDQAFGADSRFPSTYAAELRGLLQELGLSPGVDIQGLGSVSDSDLSLLYSHAEAVIIPSLIEGCSLPLLEAAALSRPVLCSDISAHREMADFYGITPFFFSAQDPLDIERALQEFLSKGMDLESLNETARRVRERTWLEVAKQYIEVFQSAL